MARRQRGDPEIRVLIKYLEGRGRTILRVLSRALPTFALWQGVRYKDNFGDNNSPRLLVIPTDLLKKILQACLDDRTSEDIDFSHTLPRIRERYYWPKLPETVHLYS